METVKIKMLKEANGSPNGYQVCSYEAGKEYDVNKSLADSFVAQGVAEVLGEKADAAPATKAEKAPKNKAA